MDKRCLWQGELVKLRGHGNLEGAGRTENDFGCFFGLSDVAFTNAGKSKAGF